MRTWARTQLHIKWRDLLYSGFAAAASGNRETLLQRVEGYWDDERHTLCTYSVRSGFDLLLQAIGVEPGDEVIYSAINVKGMVKVAKKHHMVFVPLDLDRDALAPSAKQLEEVITPRSRVLVVAHLFGALLDLDELIATAHKHGLVVVEDCAQAFDGRAYPGHPKADTSMFSFGPLKTCTALGGALVRVNDKALFERMRELRNEFPVQTDKSQFKRTVKFSLAKLVSTPLIFGLISRGMRLFGHDYDDTLDQQIRNVVPQGLPAKYRFQPSTAMLKLLAKRIHDFRVDELQGRKARGEALLTLLDGKVQVPGVVNPHHSFWVFPVLVSDPRRFIEELKLKGFDSSGWLRSRTVPTPVDRKHLFPANAESILQELVFVPCNPAMPQRELEREAPRDRRRRPQDRSGPEGAGRRDGRSPA